MANRFSQITTAGYKGLSLDEIMAIPLAKQKQQDASLAATDELESSEAKSLAGDKDIVGGELDRIRGEAEAISKQLMERGYDRNLSNKLRKLRSSKKKSFGATGIVGQAQSNYAAAQKYINDMATKKEMQAGWSPYEAKKWATDQVSKHGSSFDELGEFKQFQGAGLAEYVDTNDWILDNIKNVAKDKMPIELQNYFGVDGQLNLPQFQQALASGSIEEKSLNKIMSSLAITAGNNNKLKESLKQEAYFSNENPDDIYDFGKLSIKYDEAGNATEVWSPGKGSFGKQMYGLAYGAQSRAETRTYAYQTDSVAVALQKKGMSIGDADAMVTAMNGVYNTVNRNNFDDLKNNTNLAMDQLELDEANFLGTFGPEKLDPKNPDHKAFADIRAAQPKTYELAKKQVNDSKLSYNKWNNWLNKVEDTALKGFTPEQKKGYDLSINVDRMKDKTEKEKLIWLKKEYARQGLDINDVTLTGKHTMYSQKDGYTAVIGDGALPSSEYLVNLIRRGKITSADPEKMNTTNIWEALGDIQDDSKNRIQTELDANPYSESYKAFSSLQTGPDRNVVGSTNKMLTENFRGGAGYSVAYQGMNLPTYLETKFDFEDNDIIPAFEVRVTNGYDSNGHPLEELVVKNSKTGTILESGVIPITKGADGKVAQRRPATQLSQSTDPQLQEYGKNMMASLQFMPEIKTSSIRSGAENGVIDGMYHLNDAGERIPVTWKKTESAGQKFWKLYLGDDEVSGELFGEQAIANFLFQQSVVDEDGE